MFYAVAKGRKPGIFRSWTECEDQVRGFSGAVFKKFKTNDEALDFIKTGSFPSSSSHENYKRNFASIKSTVEQPTRKKKKKNVTEEEEMVKYILSCDFDEEEEKGAEKKKDCNPDKIHMLNPEQTTLKTYNGHQFHEDSEGFVHVYTDGSCENNGKKNAFAGLGVYFGKNHPLNSSEPVKGRATNNSGEIQAAIKAIQDAQEHSIKRLNIFTDSHFLINSVCKWMSSWKTRGWMLSNGKPVINVTDFKKLDELIQSGKTLIKWSYIAAHRGHTGNEMADKLAKEGAQKQKMGNISKS